MRSVLEIEKSLSEGALDPLLSRLYCRPSGKLAPYRNRVSHVMRGFLDTFGGDRNTPVAVFSAPGRTEIGGNHTDHQRGEVLTGSVDLDALACAAPNGTDRVRVFSEGFGMTELESLELAPQEEEKNSTKALLRGVLAGVSMAMLERKDTECNIGGFDAYVISDVPGGSGLSSSACFEVLLGTILNGLFCGNALSSTEIAQIGQFAENVHFGKPSGLMDQMGCATGGAVAIDFRDKNHPAVKPIDFDFSAAGYALCIVDSGADHADLTDDYAAIPVEMRSVAAAFGKEVLCEVEEEAFYARIPELRKSLGDRAVMRAIHYFSDCRRVEQQTAALERGDFDRFLRLVSSSGHSSYMYLQNVDTYRNPKYQPVAMALAVAGHLLDGHGARRVHGGGFAGTIQAFVPIDRVEKFRQGMDALLGGGACRVTYIRPVGGCVVAE